MGEFKMTNRLAEFQEAKKKNTELTYGEFMRKGKTPSMIKHIEGVGTVYLYGEWNAETLIKRILEEPSMWE
jgi:hypothetical protein